MSETAAAAITRSFIDGGLPEDLVVALLDEYAENKRRFFLGDYSPGAVSGGRFCEVVVRILQCLGNGSHVPLNAEVHVERALRLIENDTSLEDGLRLFVPRAIRLIYGVRNARNTAHVNGDVDPSLQDASLVVGTLDWILAELVRATHGVSADEAQGLIDGIVTKEVPLVAVYNDKPVVLAQMKQLDHLLVILYWSKSPSARVEELRAWLPSHIAKRLGRLLGAAEDERYVHIDGDEVFLTPLGTRYIERSGLLRPM